MKETPPELHVFRDDCEWYVATSVADAMALQREFTEKTRERNRLTKRLPPGVARFHQVLIHYKQRARRSKRTWALTDEQARSLMEQPCRYCGASPSAVNRAPQGWWGEFVHNGIDRVDNDAGYTARNCVPCCAACNYMKGTLSLTEFLERVERIHTHGKGARDGEAAA